MHGNAPDRSSHRTRSRRLAALLILLFTAVPSHAQLLDPSRPPSRLLPYTLCTFSGGLASISTVRAPNLPMTRPVETASGEKRVSVGAKGMKMSVERSTFDGVEIAGLDNPTIRSSQLSFYSLFDDRESIIVTVYLLNQVPEHRAFKDMGEYAKLRDVFIREYAQCLVRNRRT